MIRSFADSDTKAIYRREYVKGLPEEIHRRARRKLIQVADAERLADLNHPGHRLKNLKGDRKGTYSIRINDQWRICFQWRDGDAYNVGIEDCH